MALSEKMLISEYEAKRVVEDDRKRKERKLVIWKAAQGVTQ